MDIHGLQKTTLLDFPGHVACTLFTGGCNFRCPYCHNGNLALHPAQTPVLSEKELFAFLKKRQGILEGVCISGGEPTLADDLEDFIRRLRDMGFLVKLDTNGYRPEVLIRLCEQGLLDYVAMDIKHSRQQYHTIAGIADFDLSRICASVDFLLHSDIPYEFRTTLTAELHDTDAIQDIGQWLRGARAYYLQAYRDSDFVPVDGFHAPDRETLSAYQRLLLPMIPNTMLRGVD